MELASVMKLLVRRFIFVILAFICGLWIADSRAAERTTPVKIGALTDSWGPTPGIVGLRDGLGKLGYQENKDFVIGVRFTQGEVAALPAAARKADYKRFEALGVQILGVSADNTFAQQTFADSLNLPYPLLSDFPERRTIRSFGVLNDKWMTAIRTFFLIDPQGVVRKKWVLANPTTDVVYSATLLKDIQEIVAKK